MSTANYLIEQDYYVDEKSKYATMGHLLAFNPTKRDARLKLTFYYEDGEPTETSLVASAQKTSEWDWTRLKGPEKHKRFAMRIVSDEPVVVQATTGWNNTMNDYSRRTKDGERECAKSCLGITSLSNVWYYVDGIVIDSPNIWVRESEWAIILNPTKRPATLVMNLLFDDGEVQKLDWEIQAERLKWIYLDEVVAKKNRHYGVKFESTEMIAAQWLRVVYWVDKPGIMTFWSVPCCPAPLSWRDELG